MPPKRRPAAAKAAPKARVAAKAKAGAKAAPKRGARAPRLRVRRPAARVAEEKKGFEAYGEVETWEVPPAELLQCGRVVVTQGSYWKEEARVAGRIVTLNAKDGDMWGKMEIDGTSNDHVLRYISGVVDRQMRVHLCPKTCGQELTGDSILHVMKLKRLKSEEEEGWMTNLLRAGREGPDDELRGIREEADQVRSSSEEGRKKKDKKEKKEKSKKEKSKDKKEKRKKASRSPSRKKGQRDLDIILGNSGLDPDPHKRGKMMKRARRLVRRKEKKKKKDSSSGSGSGKGSGSGTSEETAEMDPGEVFGESKMAKKIWLKCPGVLTATSLTAMQEQLLTQQGQLYDMDRSELPPIFLQYFRTQLASRMAPAMRREGLHLAYSLDLALQGRIPQMVDVLSQRLKALEGQTDGNHWTVTSQYELVPEPKASVASALETQQAAKEAREAGRLKAQATKAYGYSQESGRGDDWKKDPSKGKNQKGGGKGQDWRKGGKSDNRDFRKDKDDRDKEKQKNRSEEERKKVPRYGGGKVREKPGRKEVS